MEWVSCEGPIPSPGPLWRRLRIFCFGSTARRGFAFPPSGAIAWCCLRCSISASLSYRFTLSFGQSSAPFGCLPLAGLFTLLLGPLWCFFAIYLPRRSHHSIVSSLLACLDGSLLCGLSDGHPYWRASGALPLFFFRLRWCLSVICPYICYQVWVAPCSIPRSFLVVSLFDFAAGLDVFPLLCPARALRIFLDRTASVQYRPCRLFVSPRCPSRALSVTAVSFLLWVVFMQPVLPGLQLSPFAHMGSVASPPL